MTDKCCGNCEFWNELHAELGQCRRRPPVIIEQLMPSELSDTEPNEEIFFATRFPVTESDEWCGLFSGLKRESAKPEAATEAGTIPAHIQTPALPG